MSSFSHMDGDGNARMVDVSGKSDTKRVAIACAEVLLNEETFTLLSEKALPKGDVLATAKIAGIMGAKQTHLLVPMCHPLPLSYVDIRFTTDPEKFVVHVEAEARTTGKTGVEMEALVAAQVAAATIFDMCKAVQKDIVIDNTRVVYKSGGKSGAFDIR